MASVDPGVALEPVADDELGGWAFCGVTGATGCWATGCWATGATGCCLTAATGCCATGVTVCLCEGAPDRPGEEGSETRYSVRRGGSTKPCLAKSPAAALSWLLAAKTIERAPAYAERLSPAAAAPRAAKAAASAARELRRAAIAWRSPAGVASPARLDAALRSRRAMFLALTARACNDPARRP